jgi:hypothetical protein
VSSPGGGETFCSRRSWAAAAASTRAVSARAVVQDATCLLNHAASSRLPWYTQQRYPTITSWCWALLYPAFGNPFRACRRHGQIQVRSTLHVGVESVYVVRAAIVVCTRESYSALDAIPEIRALDSGRRLALVRAGEVQVRRIKSVGRTTAASTQTLHSQTPVPNFRCWRCLYGGGGGRCAAFMLGTHVGWSWDLRADTNSPLLLAPATLFSN